LEINKEVLSFDSGILYQTGIFDYHFKNSEAGMYWIETPQLNTVGYLTTLAGSLVIGYSIGYLTDRFDMNVNRIELNLSQ